MTTMTTYADELREIHAVLNNRQPSMAGRLLIIADAIDAHLAKGAQVPDGRVYAPLPSDADEYDRGHVDGWNACRESMLSQRGEVEGG